MQYYSLNKQSPIVDFKAATIAGQAPDKGLYFPAHIPQLSNSFLDNYKTYSKEAIGIAVMQPYVGDCIPEKILAHIISETVDFPFPLINIQPNIAALELFHGPTLAFKDVGARFMSRCLGYFLKNKTQKVTVLVATSGDTGGAVARGFYGVEGIEVVILYPSKKVSLIQENQMTTLGKNIFALEIDGDFDACQALVKQAFTDTALQAAITLTSANSINVARWLPQQLYYFYALQQWTSEKMPVFSVPSGNFGNICSGILAKISGLPIPHFIAACNANRVVTDYLETGILHPKESIPTLSNAMDVGHPSNFVRILSLVNNEILALKNLLTSYSISDESTVETIKKVYQKTDYLLDPHGAVAFAALEKYLAAHPDQTGIFLETAHPVKFPPIVEEAAALEKLRAVEDSLIKKQTKHAVQLPADYAALKNFLINR